MKTFCGGLTIILLGLANLITPSQVSTRSSESKVIEALQSIQTLVTEIKGNVIDKNGEEFRILNRTDDSVDSLIKLGKGKAASRAYVYSIELDHSLLKSYQTRRDLSLLKIPSSDLDTKASYAEDNPNEPFKDIRVRAHTKNSQGQEQNGYRVWSALTGELASGFSMFSTQSSPAIRLLGPGDYFIYATRVDIRTEPKRYPIGDNTKPGADGYREEDIDVDVP